MLHLFCHVDHDTKRDEVKAAVAAAEGRGDQVITVSMLGHKSDLGFMVLATDLWSLRQFQTDIRLAGARIVESYVSLTEISEYAEGVPEEMKNMRLYPGASARRETRLVFLPDVETPPGRSELVHASVRTPQGTDVRTPVRRVASSRVASRRSSPGSTGIDDYEWGVTLFCVNPDDLKAVVYTMRFDEASSVYADFGPFYTGMVAPIDTVLTSVLGH